jgi:hypothetical protein
VGTWTEVGPAEIIVVEGCYAARPELRPYYDVFIWVETSAEQRAQRKSSGQMPQQDGWRVGRQQNGTISNITDLKNMPISFSVASSTPGQCRLCFRACDLMTMQARPPTHCSRLLPFPLSKSVCWRCYGPLWRIAPARKQLNSWASDVAKKPPQSRLK